jgi:hypothetical protein
MTPTIPNLTAATLLSERSPGDFRRNFEPACFAFSHTLVNLPLLDIGAIVGQAAARDLAHLRGYSR